jgi:hypothetical protein
MKTGRTLQQLAVELDRQNKTKRDFVVDGASMRMEDGAELFSLCCPPESDMREQRASVAVEPFGMTDLFHRQLGAAYGIPAKYYDKMRVEYPELLTRNVNGWLGKSESRHTVRTLYGTARAFLSDRYRRIDNYEIAKTVLPLIGEMDGANVESCEVTENRMYLKVVNPRLQAEVQKGDVVQAGIIISNSEVGLGSVSVMPLVYRLVCLNGMVVNDLGRRKYHIGRESDESWELFSDETLRADDAAFMLKLADIVRTAVDEAKFAAIVDKLREASGARLTARPASVVELTAKSYGFNQTEQDDILQHLIQSGDLSLWGLGNAVTRAAHDAPSYDRSTALEATGWQVINMPPQIFREINETR